MICDLPAAIVDAKIEAMADLGYSLGDQITSAPDTSAPDIGINTWEERYRQWIAEVERTLGEVFFSNQNELIGQLHRVVLTQVNRDQSFSEQKLDLITAIYDATSWLQKKLSRPIISH